MSTRSIQSIASGSTSTRADDSAPLSGVESMSVSVEPAAKFNPFADVNVGSARMCPAGALWGPSTEPQLKPKPTAAPSAPLAGTAPKLP